jgi:hypothetical protein
MRASLCQDVWRISFLQRELTKGRPKPPELVCTVPRGTIHSYSTIRHATTRLSDRRAVPQRSRANECPLEFVKSDLTHSSNCYYLIGATQGAAEAIRGPTSDRKTIATTVLIAGIMLGAHFTVQLKDQISLHWEFGI